MTRRLPLLLAAACTACGGEAGGTRPSSPGPAIEAPALPPHERVVPEEPGRIADLLPPRLGVRAPVEGPIRGTPLAAVRGEVAGAVSLRLLGPAGERELAATGPFAEVALLQQGPSALRLEARDAAGNRSVHEVEVEVATPVAGGVVHSAVVHEGAVVTWGGNGSGQLGVGDQEAHEGPVVVPGLPSIRSVAAGGNTTAAVGIDGSVWIWGALAGSPSPIAFPGVEAASGVAVGMNHVLVLEEDGTVVAFGVNGKGQLGLGHADPVAEPAAVPGLAEVVRVVAGSEHSAALLADGTVRVWGANADGQLGNGDIDADAHPVPVPVAHLDGVVDLAAGRGHTVALRRDGAVWAWGLGTSGQLGIGKSGMLGTRAQPVEVTGVPAIEAVYAGGQSTFALAADGTIYGFGRNGSGQLGDGFTAERASPVIAAKGLPVRAVGVGAQHAVAITASGVVAFGANANGQLGVAGTNRAVEPVEVAW